MTTITDAGGLLEEYKDVLTFAETKDILRIGRTKLYELLQTGAIPSLKIGTHYRILKADLLIYLTKNK